MKKILLASLLTIGMLPCMAQVRNSLGLKGIPFQQSYYVEITAVKGNQTTTPFEFRERNIILYSVDVKWLRMEQNKLVAEISRTSDVLVNGKGSALTAVYNLAVRTSAALYPLVLSFKADGTIEDVVNFEAVKQRWEAAKRELNEDFYGDGLVKYLHEVDKRFSGKGALIYSLKSDCFLSLLFNNLVYTSYSAKNTAVGNLYFPYLFTADPLKNLVTLEKEINDDGDIHIAISGQYADERTKADLLSKLSYSNYHNSPKPKPEFYCAYALNPISNAIIGMTFYYEMELEIEKTIFVQAVALKKGDDQPNLGQPLRLKTNGGKIYLPVELYKDMDEDVLRHLNPLLELNDMILPERKHEGIKFSVQ